ncbi:MAG: cation diffusion facilitator family transporter, partial [Burkholderiales bacterium]|nr:cation diffusion facilitator family transporter [Burkholderiales bacterium]
SRHPHAHHHSPQLDVGRAFAAGVALNVGFVVVEALAGLWINSLALLADAGHNLSDVMALLLAWGAATLAGKRPSARFTFGFKSSTVLVALVNALLLLAACGAIAWEAIGRVQAPIDVSGLAVIIVAAIGVAINTATALLFRRRRKDDLNVRGAYLHMAADALVSLGVVVAGVALWITGWGWIDPVISLAVVGVVLIGTWGLARDSLSLALHAVPPGIDPTAVRAFLAARPGVVDVHDLHIWGMSTTESALSAHLVIPGGHPGDHFLAETAHELEHRFGIGHATLQIEHGDPEHPCALEPEHVV